MHPELSKRLVLLQLQEALSDEQLFSSRVQFEELSYPRFYVRFTNHRGVIRLFRFDCTNYDFQAMAVEPVNPITREHLRPEDWPRRQRGQPFPGHYMRGGAPFLCLRGTREYYTHELHGPQTSNERWDEDRADFRIKDMLQAIANKFWTREWE